MKAATRQMWRCIWQAPKDDSTLAAVDAELTSRRIHHVLRPLKWKAGGLDIAGIYVQVWDVTMAKAAIDRARIQLATGGAA